MCGIVGFTNGKLNIDNNKVIENMMNTIGHRGPDSDGHFSDEEVTLGFRRLQIIDLSTDASQPMYNEDDSIALIFNGEIYNYHSLMDDLIAKGHTFKSQSDTEVIIHGYEEYGIDILQKLRGMFAFAIWDKKADHLFIARDFFGIKPLYYTENTTDNSFIFGSEIKTFLKHPAFKKELNKDSLKPYLTFQYSALDETFFKGVYKLRPGHYMIYKNGKMEINSYWDINFDAEENTLEYYVDKIKETMEESVNYHRISDVKVGSFLSGGVDSSYITALLKPDKTFSVGFKDYEGVFNETNLAEDLSKRLGIENHKKVIDADEFFDAIPTIQYHMDEPQANLSSVPLYFLAELASKHATVLLSGEGADEIFGGYAWYDKTNSEKKYEKIPFFLRRLASNISKALPENRITNFLVKGGLKVEEQFIGEAKVYKEKDALMVLQDSYKQGPSPIEVVRESYLKVKGKDEVTKKQYIDMKHWLPGDILLKADKMSSAHSIELRVPFLDKEVMEMAAKIPAHLKVNDKDTKYVLRKAANEVLPDEWANRPKVGFPVPFRDWIKQEKYYKRVKEVFEAEYTKEFFHTETLVGYLDEHYTGKANRARYVWTAYVFLIWYKRFFIDEDVNVTK
ncbi:asparagine synthase (glutamine-hydrolyzing) [Oceanobacillus chungangensis]|uniref:asparagine synthase (glutamine-hydrolyzing) n=1 Tax=Oceanobacillus chungangensis TaxID=1229152 RepID=A0A3D8PIK8_9BACI|nr:asparagine synthase (glutamine-hydrolyzing) [Oceanobacillus chungangensis]RDW15472.1 asparagine synthase (glutamine-hydrolyzing) [Oceanobacillus chungangensis]